VAKGAAVPPKAVHICYLHTPMRYVWDTGADYFRFGGGRWWKRSALNMVAPYLRRFDRRTSQRVDFFLANSENVRNRIRRIYKSDARVIPPPVDTDFFTPAESGPGGDYYLVVSPLEPYKRIDLAIEAFSGGKRRLVVAGSGTLDHELRRRARAPVEFLGHVPDAELRELYRHCRALIFPGLDDFGIAPVEAQACGRPVVCYGEGGALETVADGLTGVHFRPQTKQSLIEAVEKLETMRWDSVLIRRRSLAFSRQWFRDRMEAFWHSELPFSYDFAA
jgi:glycosyltransferase involved in cell wall biosynthesis